MASASGFWEHLCYNIFAGRNALYTRATELTFKRYVISPDTGSRLRAAFFVLRCRNLNIFVYSDESGVLDKVHNQYFVFGGILFLSKEEKDIASRKYSAAERVIRNSGQYGADVEVKASTITAGEKRKLYRSLNGYYKFGVIVHQSKVFDSIMADKKSKQRYLDFVFKIGVKRLLQELICRGIVIPDQVENMYFFVDEHSTSTNGLYELSESLEEEFKRGMYSRDFTTFFPPLFPKVQSVNLKFCNSSAVRLVRAADIIANRVYHDALSGNTQNPFNGESNKLFITNLP